MSYRVLELLGFPMAPAVIVQISDEFAGDVTREGEYAPGVIGGRHWGTVFLDDAYGPDPSSILNDELDDPTQLFLLYLADELLGNPDRDTPGNVLLRPRESDSKKFEIIPIDQSDAFRRPSCLGVPGCLNGAIVSNSAKILPTAEAAILAAGTGHLEALFDAVEEVEDDLASLVNLVPEEWVDRGGIDAEEVREFLSVRAHKIRSLAGYDDWRGKCDYLKHHGALLLDFGGGEEE